MNDRDVLFLQHIVDAVADIDAFTAECHAFFVVDRKTQSAVIRQFEIIGEAVQNLTGDPTICEPAVPWRQIAGTRGRLIHAQFSVDLDAVWSMFEQDLPLLRVTVRRLLAAAAGH